MPVGENGKKPTREQKRQEVEEKYRQQLKEKQQQCSRAHLRQIPELDQQQLKNAAVYVDGNTFSPAFLRAGDNRTPFSLHRLLSVRDFAASPCDRFHTTRAGKNKRRSLAINVQAATSTRELSPNERLYTSMLLHVGQTQFYHRRIKTERWMEVGNQPSPVPVIIAARSFAEFNLPYLHVRAFISDPVVNLGEVQDSELAYFCSETDKVPSYEEMYEKCEAKVGPVVLRSDDAEIFWRDFKQGENYQAKNSLYKTSIHRKIKKSDPLIFNQAAFLAWMKQVVSLELHAIRKHAGSADVEIYHKAMFSGLDEFCQVDGVSIKKQILPLIMQAYLDVLRENQNLAKFIIEFPTSDPVESSIVENFFTDNLGVGEGVDFQKIRTKGPSFPCDEAGENKFTFTHHRYPEDFNGLEAENRIFSMSVAQKSNVFFGNLQNTKKSLDGEIADHCDARELFNPLTNPSLLDPNKQFLLLESDAGSGAKFLPVSDFDEKIKSNESRVLRAAVIEQENQHKEYLDQHAERAKLFGDGKQAEGSRKNKANNQLPIGREFESSKETFMQTFPPGTEVTAMMEELSKLFLYCLENSSPYSAGPLFSANSRDAWKHKGDRLLKQHDSNYHRGWVTHTQQKQIKFIKMMLVYLLEQLIEQQEEKGINDKISDGDLSELAGHYNELIGFERHNIRHKEGHQTKTWLRVEEIKNDYGISLMP